MTTVFPAAIAGMKRLKLRRTGEFHGEMTAVTPLGRRRARSGAAPLAVQALGGGDVGGSLVGAVHRRRSGGRAGVAAERELRAPARRNGELRGLPLRNARARQRNAVRAVSSSERDR